VNRSHDSLKFSILTATHNCFYFVADCIRSVISQRYDNWEMIIVDDCSTDKTFNKVSQLAATDTRIKAIRNKKRLYCGANYKKILSMASGDICGVLDGDDMLSPVSVKMLVQYYLDNPEIDFIWTNHVWFNKNMTRHKKGISSTPKRGSIYKSEDGLKHVYSHWRTFRTKLRDRGTLFNDKLRCAVDKDLGYTLEELGRGAYLNEPVYHYRYHPLNMSHGSNQKQTWREIRKLHKNKKRFESIVL
jgi:glycosyltransferase involved in cell wall biosynthesis